MPETEDEARRWLRYARQDLAGARSSAEYRHVVFFAQQAAEKALKAILVYLGQPVPFTMT